MVATAASRPCRGTGRWSQTSGVWLHAPAPAGLSGVPLADPVAIFTPPRGWHSAARPCAAPPFKPCNVPRPPNLPPSYFQRQGARAASQHPARTDCKAAEEAARGSLCQEAPKAPRWRRRRRRRHHYHNRDWPRGAPRRSRAAVALGVVGTARGALADTSAVSLYLLAFLAGALRFDECRIRKEFAVPPALPLTPAPPCGRIRRTA